MALIRSLSPCDLSFSSRLRLFTIVSVFQEDKNRSLLALLEGYIQKYHSAKFHCKQRRQGQPRFKDLEKCFTPLDKRSIKVILAKKHLFTDGRNHCSCVYKQLPQLCII